MPSLAMESPTSTSAESGRDAGLVLKPLRGQTEAALYPLAIGRHVIGSSPDATIRIDLPGVAAQHAVLMVGPQRSVLKAFSRFTWINDGVVRECAIKPGDRICLGPVEFEVMKGKRRRRPQPTTPVTKAHNAVVIQSQIEKTFGRPTASPLMAAAPAAPAPLNAGSFSQRRERLVEELNTELLQQLSDLVHRETIAAEQQRRLIEQGAQVEGRRRILEERQALIEQSQSQLASAETDWRRRMADLNAEAEKLRSERDSVARDRANLAAELERLDQQGRAIDDRRASLDRRESQINDVAARLDLRAATIAAQEQQHAMALTQALETSRSQTAEEHRIAELTLSLDRQTEELREQRLQFEHERQIHENERAKLFAERAHLATREVEIAELRRQCHEQQARATESRNLIAGTADNESTSQRLAEIADREGRLVEQEAALLRERAELDERKSDLDRQHAEWMLTRHADAARSDAAEIAAPTGGDNADLESLQEEIAKLQMLLDRERADFQAARESWDAEQDLLLRDRRNLEEQWQRLESRISHSYQPAPTPPISQPVSAPMLTPPPIPMEYTGVSEYTGIVESVGDSEYEGPVRQYATPVTSDWSHATDDHAVDHADTQYEPVASDDWTTSDADIAPTGEYAVPNYGGIEAESVGEEATGYPQYDADPSYVQPYDSDETADDESMSSAPLAPANDVSALRAQLAELFGIQPGQQQEETGGYEESSYGSEEQFTGEEGFQGAEIPDQFSESVVDEMNDEQSIEPAAEASSSLVDADAPAQEPQSDEEIMSAYLSRLLKKTPQSEAPAPAPVPVAPTPVIDEPVESSEEPKAEDANRNARRLNAEEKETLRANLDSFREIANQQARAAVAKHKSNELKSGLQMTSVIAALVTVVGIVLVTAEFWTKESYRTYGLAALAISSVEWVITLTSSLKIRRLRTIERAASDMSEAFSSADVPEEPTASPVADGR